MQFFTGTNSDLDAVTDARALVKSGPHLQDRFDAIKELRDNGDPLSSAPHFRRVASIIAPVHLLTTVLEPEFLTDKRKFYRWLDAHQEYCTYDRRAARAKTLKSFHGWSPEQGQGVIPV